MGRIRRFKEIFFLHEHLEGGEESLKHCKSERLQIFGFKMWFKYFKYLCVKSNHACQGHMEGRNWVKTGISP